MIGSMAHKITNIIESIKDVRDAHIELDRQLSHGPASFYFDRLSCYITGLFSFSKFKIGDKVKLVKTVDPVPHGWSGHGHFLIKNATAVIRDVDFDTFGFNYLVSFDKETWIDPNGKKRPTTERHQFRFKEADLSSANK